MPLLLDTLRGKFNFNILEISYINFYNSQRSREKGSFFTDGLTTPTKSKKAQISFSPVGCRNSCKKKNKKILPIPCMPQIGVKFQSITHFSSHAEICERLCHQLVKPCLFKEQTSAQEVSECLIRCEMCN